MDSAEHRKNALRVLIEAALPAIESLPCEQRADAFEGIAIACERDDAQVARTASGAANALREAMSAQLLFRTLLS